MAFRRTTPSALDIHSTLQWRVWSGGVFTYPFSQKTPKAPLKGDNGVSSKVLRRGLFAVLVVVALVAGVVIGMAYQARTVSAQPQAQVSPHHAQTIVDKYLGILNAGMKSGTCDFSALSSVYTPNAAVRLTGGPFAPGGPFGPGGSFGEQQFHGMAAITSFYVKLCHVVSQKGVAQWKQDAGYLLSPNVLNSYEEVDFAGQVGGRCMHVFTISGDHIASLDWSVYA